MTASGLESAGLWHCYGVPEWPSYKYSASDLLQPNQSRAEY